MFTKIKNNQILKSLFNTQNIGLYALAIVALSVTWSSMRIIQKNYDLQKSISKLEQEVAVLDQQTKNQKLINEYYKTDSYLNLAARKYFSKAAPGEKLIIVPEEVARTYIHPIENTEKKKSTINPGSKLLENLRAWNDFLRHKNQD